MSEEDEDTVTKPIAGPEPRPGGARAADTEQLGGGSPPAREAPPGGAFAGPPPGGAVDPGAPPGPAPGGAVDPGAPPGPPPGGAADPGGPSGPIPPPGDAGGPSGPIPPPGDAGGPGQTPPPGGGGGPGPRRLTRRADGQVLGGVASGLGAYFGIDPLVFRILFVVLTLAGGTGLVLYAALWILLPPETGAEPVGQTALRRPSVRAWVGVALFGLAALLLSDAIGFQRPSIIWALALITIGVLLCRQEATGGAPGGGAAAPAGPDQMGRAAPAGGPPPGWGAPPPAGWGAPPAGWGGGAAAAGSAPAPPAGSRPSPRPWGVPPPGGWGSRRPPSVLGLLTVAVAVLAVGVAALLDNLGAVEMTLGRSLALFLVVIGLGLVVGAWRGWSAGLVVLGLLMVPTVAAASLADVPFAGGVGDRVFQPRSAAEVRSDYQLAFGRLTVDLHEVRFGKDPTRIRASVGMGEVVVYVPEGVPVEAHGRAGAGHVDFFDRTEDGVQVELTETAAGSERVGRLRLDLSVGYGAVRVVRSPPEPPAPLLEPRIQGEVG